MRVSAATLRKERAANLWSRIYWFVPDDYAAYRMSSLFQLPRKNRLGATGGPRFKVATFQVASCTDTGGSLACSISKRPFANFHVHRDNALNLETPAAACTTLRHRKCRRCRAQLTTTFVDLGMSPLCQSFLPADQIDLMEPYFPLHVLVCSDCFLVQLPEHVKPENIFSEYAYFSSYSTFWVEHARRYCEMIQARLGLGPKKPSVRDCQQ